MFNRLTLTGRGSYLSAAFKGFILGAFYNKKFLNFN